jgi:hypothetical protein
MPAGAKERLQTIKCSERVRIESQISMRAVEYVPHLADSRRDMGHPRSLLVWKRVLTPSLKGEWGTPVLRLLPDTRLGHIQEDIRHALGSARCVLNQQD